VTVEEMRRIQDAEAYRARFKASLDRGAADRTVVKELGQVAAAFSSAYKAMWGRLEEEK
jgi:hypothetical protein